MNKRKPGRPVSAMPTTAQRKTLSFILRYRNTMGYSPTEREIAAALKISASAARDRLSRLVARGLIKRTKKQARSLTLLPEGVAQAIG